jgi:PilZ domain
MNILSRASTAIGSLERRAHRRFSYPALQLEIDGKRFKTTDWSLGGFRITGYRGAPKIGDRLSGQIKSLNSSAPGTFVAEVVRIAETGEIGLRLLEITPAVFLAMAGFKDY